jgi:DNA polymerase III epsilon subunit-like protein
MWRPRLEYETLAGVMRPLVYFSLDIEASGTVPPLYNMLSIGVTTLREKGDHHVMGQSFYIELKPIVPRNDPDALAVCGLDIEQLSREGVEPREAMMRLTDWVERETGDRAIPVFVGHNAVFDWSHIAYYYAHFGMENPFGYKGIELKSLAMGRLGIGWNETSKENLQVVLDLPLQDPARTHRADYDAQYQALILKKVLEWRRGESKA